MWNSDEHVWEWTVETDGLDPDCPIVAVQNGHDNTLIPLPNGEFKMYYKDRPTDQYHVVYWDGSQWEDDVLIEFHWDSSGSGPDHKCIENVSAFVHRNGAVIHEGMFFMIMDSADLNCGGIGLDDDPPADTMDGGIVFAEHVN